MPAKAPHKAPEGRHVEAALGVGVDDKFGVAVKVDRGAVLICRGVPLIAADVVLEVGGAADEVGGAGVVDGLVEGAVVDVGRGCSVLVGGLRTVVLEAAGVDGGGVEGLAVGV